MKKDNVRKNSEIFAKERANNAPWFYKDEDDLIELRREIEWDLRDFADNYRSMRSGLNP